MTDHNGTPNRTPLEQTPTPRGDRDPAALIRRVKELTAELAAATSGLEAAEEARERAEAEARRQSFTDELTGLLTRRGFLMMADLAWKIARRCGVRCALMCADVDGLAAVNARHGREAGDELLRSAARVLRQTLRDADIVARIGGDEFAVFGLTGEGSASLLISRLDDAIATFNQGLQSDLPVELSVGAVDLQWSGSVTLETLLAEAERAMTRGKRSRKVHTRNE